MRYDMEAQAIPEMLPDYERDRRHLHNTQAGALLPLTQAIITAGSLAAAIAVILWLLKIGEWWKFAIASFFCILAIAWMLMLIRWSRLTAPLEKLTGWDINGDGEIGEDPVMQTLKVELKHDNHRTDFYYLPYADRLQEFAAQVVSGIPIAEASFCGAGGIFSRSEYVRLRDALLKWNIAAWRSPDTPARGIVLTPSGRSVIKYIASNTHPSESDYS